MPQQKLMNFLKKEKLLGTSHKVAYKELQHVIREANLKGNKISKQHRLMSRDCVAEIPNKYFLFSCFFFIHYEFD